MQLVTEGVVEVQFTIHLVNSLNLRGGPQTVLGNSSDAETITDPNMFLSLNQLI